MDFYDKLFKNCHFWPKLNQKGHLGPVETPQDHENNFFELPGYENPLLEKKTFLIISYRKKVVLTIPSEKIDLAAIDLLAIVMVKISV